MHSFLALNPHSLVYGDLGLLVMLLMLNFGTLSQLSLDSLPENWITHLFLYLVDHVVFAGCVLLI